MKFSLFKPNYHKLAISVFVIIFLLSGAYNGKAKAADLETIYSNPLSQLFNTTIALASEEGEPEVQIIESIEPIINPTPEQVKAEIIRQAHVYGVSVNTALRIARCESGYLYNAKSQTSTAKGVYQFINGTWEWIGAEGHQYDYRENINQFMKWYPRYPQWWECK